ncbi:MAG TPA: zf-TFIIB domain-containing protein [Nocardioides sp.]|nr:zf-TFIIB domain-containing protein [Nocardioides sp.]
MQCPNDGAALVMSERSGIEIDYCPTCRGVWLDRGELDKIIERSFAQSAPPPAPAPAPSYDRGRSQQPYPQPGYQQGHYKKRKESWLSELFD